MKTEGDNLKRLLRSREMKQFMILRNQVHEVCSLLNRDCHLCYQIFPSIYSVCPYVRNTEHAIFIALLRGF